MSLHEEEGFVPVGEYRVWYRIVGGGADQENTPLLTLHGGPGVPHDYITDMAALASPEFVARSPTSFNGPPFGSSM